MLESLNLAEEEEENSACWIEGAKERNADISCSVMPRSKRDTCCINLSERRRVGDVLEGQGRRGDGEFLLKRRKIEACKTVFVS